MHSKQWHYSLHRDFQNCYSTRRSPTGFFKLQFQLQFYTCTLHYNPENSPSRIQFYTQKTKSSSNTTTTYRGQRTFIPEKKFYAWKARRSSRNASVCLTRPSNDIPGIPATRPSKGTPVTPVAPETSRTFQSFMTFQPFQAILQILQCSSISRESTPFKHSPIRMHILHILQFLQFDWFPQKTPPNTS